MVRKRKWKLGWIRQLFDSLIKSVGLLDGGATTGLCQRGTIGVVLARSPNL